MKKLLNLKLNLKIYQKQLTCAGFPIREYDNKIPSNLTAEQILVRSGNIGSVRIGQKVGEEKFKLFLSKIGILKKINFDIDEVGKPIKFNWGKCPLQQHLLDMVSLQLYFKLQKLIQLLLMEDMI